ncbi:hypothetical protein BQ8482_300006 [Mesorhizobium delmotii]|uniref:Uncharacterized protein n=1 Tax=Mesorhizobium delmotii TaxID=1631247 RepID=A0A2P9ANA9_9HYPH|nr:hypothetical protein BQ8482_300006 [Mesorhizobium delmotii]
MVKGGLKLFSKYFESGTSRKTRIGVRVIKRYWKAGRWSRSECKARGTCRHRSSALRCEREDDLAGWGDTPHLAAASGDRM